MQGTAGIDGGTQVPATASLFPAPFQQVTWVTEHAANLQRADALFAGHHELRMVRNWELLRRVCAGDIQRLLSEREIEMQLT